MRDGKVYSASRLDRIYTNVHHVLLQKFDVLVLTLWHACAADASSDHAPVAAEIHARRVTGKTF